jgi:hypothetical protein
VHDDPAEHRSQTIRCNPRGDELVGVGVHLSRFDPPYATGTAVMVEVTEDGQTESFPLDIDQARVLGHALRRLIARVQAEEAGR